MLGDLSEKIESSSLKFTRQSFLKKAVPEPVAHKYRMIKPLKYNRTLDPDEHITAYTCAGKGDDRQDDKFELTLVKRLGEALSKRTTMWHRSLRLASQTGLAYQRILLKSLMPMSPKQQ